MNIENRHPDGAARLVKYYYAGALLLARQEGAARRWYHQDHLGSVRAMTDAAGVREVAYEYAAFGDTIQTVGAADNLRGYGAHWRDDESHLVYMGARYQDPVLGRFTQPDPVIPEPGDPQSWNRYSYVRNNPVNRIDPTGHIDLGAELGGFLADRIGVNRAIGSFVGSLANGAVPGAGELADVGVLFSLDHKVGTGERLLAVGSLVASVATFGTSPNVGSVVGKADEALKAGEDALSRVVRHGDDAAEAPERVAKRYSKEKEALVDMAQSDKHKGITEADMEAYKDLNRELTDRFPENKVRGYEAHRSGGPQSQRPHGHVGPVDHIPITDVDL